MTAGLTPELELLALAVGVTVDADDDRLQTLARSDPDWQQVAELADGHGVTPHLHRRIESLREVEVPASVQSQLTTRTRSIARRNLRFVDELHSVLELLSDAGVRALPFKGPVLASFAYGDLSARAFGDLDLLVHPDDISTAVDRLEERGYEWEGETSRRDDSPLLGGPLTPPIVDEYTLWRDGIELEVRSRVGDANSPFTPDFETLWARRDTVAVGGQSMPALAPDDRLLMLAFHGTKHMWHLLKWACDFEAALQAAGIDWSSLLARAKSHDDERKLLVGVSLIESLFDPTVPPTVRRRFAVDERAHSLADEVIDYYTHSSGRPAFSERKAYLFRASESRRDRLRILACAIPLHPRLPDYRLLPLPGVYHPVYYLVRPVRAVADRVTNLVNER